MLCFTLVPLKGAAPILFGMPRSQVHQLLGKPGVESKESDSWGPALELNVGYASDGTVNHIGLSPGAFELRFRDELVWVPNSRQDPNPLFLRYEVNPMERLGFLVFPTIGITTTGFHDDDPSQLAITAFPHGAWDESLLKAKRPCLSKYAETSKLTS